MQKAQNRASHEEQKSKTKQQILDKKAYLDSLNQAQIQKEKTKELIKQQLIQKGYSAVEAQQMAAKLSADQESQ